MVLNRNKKEMDSILSLTSTSNHFSKYGCIIWEKPSLYLTNNVFPLFSLLLKLYFTGIIALTYLVSILCK